MHLTVIEMGRATCFYYMICCTLATDLCNVITGNHFRKHLHGGDGDAIQAAACTVRQSPGCQLKRQLVFFLQRLRL